MTMAVNRKHTCINTISRRKFVKSVSGAAVCCACFSQDLLMIESDKAHLASVCGTYCGACPAYISKHSPEEQIKKRFEKRKSSRNVQGRKTIPDPGWMDGLLCDGCMSGGLLAAHCQRCAIKLCAADKQDVKRCSDCKELPCFRITNMINTGLLHRAEYMPNLEKIRKMGVQEWVSYEEKRWSCPGCGQPVSWYDAECTWCNAPRSEKLFSLI